MTENDNAPSVDGDAALVASSRQGNLHAFETLVVRHQKRMLNIAFRLIGDHDDACEVVQDAFVSAFKNIRTFRGEAKFTTWRLKPHPPLNLPLEGGEGYRPSPSRGG